MMGMDNVISFLMEKLKEALLTVLNFVGQPLIWLKNFGCQVLLSLQNAFGGIVRWFDEVFPPETRVEKIKYWFHLALPYLIIALLVLSLLIFCYFYLVLLLTAVLNLLKIAYVGLIGLIKIMGSVFINVMSLLKTACVGLIKIIKSVCVGLIKIIKSVFTCCWASSEPVVKMMKAPGRAGVMMARAAFESSPKLYFAGLRAGDTLV